MRILVAEDEGVSRVVLSTKLKELGHEVIEARDGSEAWSRYQEELPRIIITDWMMPGMDGGDLCQLVRAQVDQPYTYIVVLTSLSGKGRYLEAMDAGADDFLTKPVDMDELTARLRVAERVLALQTEVQLMQTAPPHLHGLQEDPGQGRVLGGPVFLAGAGGLRRRTGGHPVLPRNLQGVLRKTVRVRIGQLRRTERIEKLFHPRAHGRVREATLCGAQVVGQVLRVGGARNGAGHRGVGDEVLQAELSPGGAIELGRPLRELLVGQQARTRFPRRPPKGTLSITAIPRSRARGRTVSPASRAPME